VVDARRPPVEKEWRDRERRVWRRDVRQRGGSAGEDGWRSDVRIRFFSVRFLSMPLWRERKARREEPWIGVSWTEKVWRCGKTVFE
jgi:hypothetical protein